jgi:acyl-CoA thioesterase-1
MSANLQQLAGKIFRVDPVARRFELLTETAYDPQTLEGRSRHVLYWNEQTQFTQVVTQHSLAGITGDWWARLDEWDREKGVVMKMTLSRDGVTDLARYRDGVVEVAGQSVPIRLRGPRSEVRICTAAQAAMLNAGFWAATVSVAGNVAERMELYPQIDPRAVDDPQLPRILVIGDSISMNYHDAAKAALRGIANYYRIEGNGGPSDRGVACAELWLGDYTQPGLQWDVIQFNHGLHDLKRVGDGYQVALPDYQANLEREIQILKKTGAMLVWCTTTPVPNDSTGNVIRRKDDDLIYNRAALEVMRRHPEIHINDLNAFIRASPAFDQWRQGKDVHFWDAKWAEIVGRAVADALVAVLRKRPVQR